VRWKFVGTYERFDDWEGTHIVVTDPATSVHRVSMSSFKVCRAKILSSGSSSARKPSTPEADVKPGMAEVVVRRAGDTLDLICLLMRDTQEIGEVDGDDLGRVSMRVDLRLPGCQEHEAPVGCVAC
jgi:hypothetical protein